MGNYDYANESLGDTIRNNKKTAIAIMAFIVGLLLINYVVIPNFYGANTNKVKDFNEIVRTSDIIRGKKDSNVTVVLFEDPQCPACQALSKQESEKLESYRDRVRFVYKYIKAVPGHKFSKEAISYMYAAELSSKKGYELVEKSYKSTANPQLLTKSEFLDYAKELELDITDLVSKANSKEVISFAAQQEEDFEFKYPAIEGYTKSPMRINGTPGAIIIIDGKLNKVTTGPDRSMLVDQTKDFTASMISSYLDKYFNPQASSQASDAPSVQVVPTPIPAQ